jgi:hypothetical protein
MTRGDYEFLMEVEKLYLAGGSPEIDMAKQARKNIGLPEQWTESEISSWHYWLSLTKPLIRESYTEPVALSEMLVPVEVPAKTASTSYLRGFYMNHGEELSWPEKHRCEPTARLKELLNSAGLIYDLKSQHYYFEATAGCLYIKYQSIIGSRLICFLK